MQKIYLVLVGVVVSLASLQLKAMEGSETPLTYEQVTQRATAIDQEFAATAAVDPAQVMAKYKNLDPQHLVPQDLLQTTLVYFDANRAKFKNQNVISVVDFRPKSDRYRFFMIHLKDGSVERFHTSHGNGSVDGDPAFATKFGNVPESNMSSLGFARTAEVYTGSLGRSLFFDGLSVTNSKVRERGIIIHGSDQMHEADVVQGLSGGCLMFDLKIRDYVIDQLKGGSLIYAGLHNP